MVTSSHDFVTVDMRGLKAALVARAQEQRITVSALVRAALAKALGAGQDEPKPAANASSNCDKATVKLSIRMAPAEAERLAAGAKNAGMSRGAFLAGLIDEIPLLTEARPRGELLNALVASNAELSSLTRNLHHLTALLRQGEVRAAQEYRQMLDMLGTDVRLHLSLVAGALTDLRPRRGVCTSNKKQAPERRSNV